MVGEGILTKGGVMDIREHIKEKGRWEGQQEGMQQVVLNMLKEKADMRFICKVTGAFRGRDLKAKEWFL